MVPKVTLLQLVQAVSEFAESEAELIATVVALVNGGSVELAGTFRGCRFAFEKAASVGV